MNVIRTCLPDVVVLEPRVFPDERGSFRTAFRADEFASEGLEHAFVQDNVSVSGARVLRGLHFQEPNGQTKLVCVTRGEVFDVAVDVRVGSPTFGRATWATLSESNCRQFLVPSGYAHGFVVTSPHAVVVYKCSRYYSPADERTIRWDDPALAIPWPVSDPVLAPRDASAPMLHEMSCDRLPRWT
ncbi:MAG TPA: dTDP-4-dehydrorhamnose 3,5-epimerase [Gemmatimonadaceae bacterium]|jgi:dTDP-4-dehydrorhamnose 3,5-epimerase